MASQEQIKKTQGRSPGGVMDLSVATFGYRARCHIRRSPLEYFSPKRLIELLIPHHPDPESIRRAIRNKVNRMKPRDKEALKKRTVQRVVEYHRDSWQIIFDDVNYHRGDVLYNQILPAFHELNQLYPGTGFSAQMVKDALAAMSHAELVQLTDDLARRNPNCQLVNNIMALSRADLRWLVLWFDALPPDDVPAPEKDETVASHGEMPVPPSPAILESTAVQQLLQDILDAQQQAKPAEVAQDPPKTRLSFLRRRMSWVSVAAMVLMVGLGTAFGPLLLRSAKAFYQLSDDIGPKPASRAQAAPDNPDALFGKAHTLYQNGDLNASLQTLAQLAPLIDQTDLYGQARIHYLRGMVYGFQGQVPHARSNLNFAITAFESLGLWGNAGRALREMGRSYLPADLDKAEEYLQKAKKYLDYSDDPNKAMAINNWYSVAFDLYLYKGDYEMALYWAREHLNNPHIDQYNRAYAWSEIAFIHGMRGELLLARQAYDHSLAQGLASDHFHVYHKLAEMVIQKQSGQPIGDLHQAISAYLTTTQNHSLEARLQHLETLDLAASGIN